MILIKKDDELCRKNIQFIHNEIRNEIKHLLSFCLYEMETFFINIFLCVRG